MRFRAAGVVLFATVALSRTAFPQEGAAPRMGLTAAQIVAMSSDQWTAKYTAKFGDTTMGMAGALNPYAGAQRELNRKALANSSSRKRLEGWIASVTRYGQATFDIQSRGGWIDMDTGLLRPVG